MFGLDDSIAAFSDGTAVLLVTVVAVLLGLRHATDPDHLAAVTTLVSGKRASARRAGSLALAWGLGHATTLFAFGLPIVLYRAYLPGPVQQGAEAAVGVVIVLLAAWLLLRWHRGVFHSHSDRDEAPQARSRLGAYGIGLVHGMGGSAGVGVLLLSTIESHAVAVVALAVFAVFTAVSMALLSAGYGLTLAHARVERSFGRVAPVLGSASMAFGVWYALGAVNLAPYWL